MDDSEVNSGKIGQEQIHSLLFGDQLSWQAIIYDLINTEQLNPWDVDLALLANKFLERIKDFEGENFYVSSKVLLAASLLLRIKSEILLNQDLPTLDDILFGKKVEKRYIQERIELDDEIPDLVPRTPLPRSRKVTLQELMSALGKAINTENRRIRKVVTSRQQEMETALILPRKQINLKDQIGNVYSKLRNIFSKDESRLAFSKLINENSSRDEKIATFVPLLHLDTQHKILLEQENHVDEIWIWLKKIYERENKSELDKMQAEVEAEIVESGVLLSKEELDEVKNTGELNRD